MAWCNKAFLVKNFELRFFFEQEIKGKFVGQGLVIIEF